jgi:hypothetical protein
MKSELMTSERKLVSDLSLDWLNHVHEIATSSTRPLLINNSSLNAFNLGKCAPSLIMPPRCHMSHYITAKCRNLDPATCHLWR